MLLESLNIPLSRIAVKNVHRLGSNAWYANDMGMSTQDSEFYPIVQAGQSVCLTYFYEFWWNLFNLNISLAALKQMRCNLFHMFNHSAFTIFET